MTQENVAVERKAQCSCGQVVPSSKSLPFFESTAEGSRDAVESCKHCGYFRVAHTPEVIAKNKSLKCTNFEPHGAYEFDRYYCGCRGWD